MLEKAISLGLPTYNEEGNIYKTLDNLISILNQEFEEYEIIVVDNNSKDKTIDRVKKFIKNNQTILSNKIKVKVIENEKNILYSGSVEKIINFSKYDYVVIMDSDGQYNPFDVINCYKFITRNNQILIFK